MRRLLPLLLIRHAEAQHHIHEITGGWTDTDLTEKGRQQVGLLADRLKRDLPGVPLYLASSDLKRAVQTAAILGRELQAEPKVFSELKDLNNGAAAGKSKAEARSLAIEPHEPLLDWQPYPQAESWRQFYKRISCFMSQLMAREDVQGIVREDGLDAAVIIVTHAAVIEAIVHWWIRPVPEVTIHFEAAPASLTVLRVNHWEERMIERLNDTAHLYSVGMIDRIRL